MNIAKLVAHIVVHRPRWLIAAVIVVVLACVWIVRSQQRFDSEVLSLLPAHLESVQALKEMNSNFSQARELTFALEGDPAVVTGFEEHFLESLRAEPWVVRVFAGSPAESPEGLEVLQQLLPALMLNLDRESFAAVLPSLSPDAIANRLRRLREEIEAGSPKAEWELRTDPLGLLAAAMKPMASIYGAESGESFAAADGTLKLFPVVTNQPSLSQPDCKALMEQVEAFKQSVLASWSGPAPQILVTGRSAYVAEISSSMRRDLQLTSAISIIAVSALFYFGFRRFVPLVGITFILALSCFLAFAIGCLLFNSLNAIAIAFCSILVGLGDDFSLLLYNRYLQARNANQEHEAAIATSIEQAGKSIFFVALTVGSGFLVLLFSASAGFAQLGVLIAVGIVLCAVCMIAFLFLFIRPQESEERTKTFGGRIGRFVDATLRKPAALGLPMCVLCAVVLAFAVLPIRPLRFDTSPRSLEPKNSPAALALKTIIDKIAGVKEPIVLLVSATNPQEAHDRWARLTAHLQTLVESGELRSVSTPAALMISPARLRENSERLRSADLQASLRALDDAALNEGFTPEAFDTTRVLLRTLSAGRTDASLDLRETIPATSSWWFLLDRYFSATPDVTAAYLTTAGPMTASEQAQLQTRIEESGVSVKLTGWSFTMASLVPWAKRELVLFSGLIGGLILVLLAFTYREWRAWSVHTVSLVFSLAGTIATLKLAGIQINMLNILAFPLILGIGVDYGMHVLFATRESGKLRENLATVLKPVVISGLTTMTGFGALLFARNTALNGLGMICAIGIFWCLVSSILFVLPVFYLWRINAQRDLLLDTPPPRQRRQPQRHLPAGGVTQDS